MGREAGQALAHELGHGLEAVALHEGLQACAQVADHLVAVQHGAGADLHRVGAHQQELHGVLGGLDAALTRHEDDIAKLEAKLREARAKQKTIQARQETATSQLKVRRRIHDKRIEDAFTRFEHMERRIDAVEGEVESFDLGKGKSLSDEIAELEAESAIMNELENLKTRVGGKDAATGRK